MATYSNIGIKLITTGDESGTWGDTTNTNFSDILDEAIAGAVTYNIASDADVTLTVSDGSSSDARHAVINFTSTTLTATRTITFAPDTLQKTWLVINSTTGGQSLTFKQGSAGATVTVPNGESAIIYSDGAGATNGAITKALDSFTNTKITTGTLNATTLDLTNLEVTNVKAKDGTAALTIADSTGKVTVSSELAVDNLNLSGNAITSTDTNGNIDLTPDGTGEVNITKVDIDAGTIDGTTISTSDITVGAGKTLDVSAGTLTLANDQISGDKIEGGTINAITINTLTSTTVNGTTFDTNVADAGVTLSGVTLSADGTNTNIDINITPKGTGEVNLTKVDIDGGAIDGTAIGVNSASTGAFTTLLASSTVTLSGGTANGVLYLNGSKEATSGSALTFTGTNLGIGTASAATPLEITSTTLNGIRMTLGSEARTHNISAVNNGRDLTIYPFRNVTIQSGNGTTEGLTVINAYEYTIFGTGSSYTERMRLTDTGLGIGTSSPGSALVVSGDYLNNKSDIGIINTNSGRSWRIGDGIGAITSSLVFWDATASAARMVIDASGNVGIGTSSPAQKLHVVSSSRDVAIIESTDDGANNGPYLNLYRNSATPAANDYVGFLQFSGKNSSGNAVDYGWIGMQATAVTTSPAQKGDIVFSTANAAAPVERLRLDSAGNLGLGVTPSAWRSTEKAIQIGSWMGLYTDSGLTTEISYNQYINSSNQRIYQNTGYASRYQQYLGEHIWFTAGSGTAGNQVSFTTVMKLDASGNLLVGATSAAGTERLNVVGGIGIRINEDGLGTKVLSLRSDFAGAGPAVNVTTNDPLLFQTNNTERARITSGGLFQVTADGSNQTFTNSGQIAIKNTGSSPWYSWHESTGARIGYFQMNSAGAAILNVEANQPLAFYTNNTERARIDSSGNFYVGTTTASPTLNNIAGFYVGAAGQTQISADAAPALLVNRKNADGVLINFYNDGVPEGDISVSGATVSYNPFMGSHYTEIVGEMPTLKGTVLESVDELVTEKYTIQDRLPKAKISDAIGSKAVYGVYFSPSSDPETEHGILAAALGASWVRVNGSVTVQKGDLLESNGDGTARVQADDIIRSSTIGKVTSTVKTHEYDDGSYCVPTVLYCG